MSDIFREVDEDIRQEKYRHLWQRFGSWVIGAAVLIVVATAGHRGWLYWQETQSQTAGDTFYDAVRLSEAGDFAGAQSKYAELENAIGGYPALARFRQATDLANQNKMPEALAAFDALSKDNSLAPALRDMAALRAGYLAVDSETYTAVADRVEGLTGDTSAFRGAARELLALSAWKNGEVEAARSWIAAVVDDPESPSEVQQRVGLLADLIRASHGDDAGSAEGKTQ